MTKMSNSQMPFRYSHYDESFSGARKHLVQQRGGPRINPQNHVVFAENQNQFKSGKLSVLQEVPVQYTFNQQHSADKKLNMMVLGGQATLSSKQFEKKNKLDSSIKTKKVTDPHKESNKDLHNLDPSFIISSSRKRAYYTVKSGIGSGHEIINHQEESYDEDESH